MSKSVNGTFVGSGVDFVGTFSPDQSTTFVILGTFSKPIPSFNSSSASITYNDMQDFTGSYEITIINPICYVGQDSVDILFTKSETRSQLRLTGRLVNNIPNRITICGYGKWYTP